MTKSIIQKTDISQNFKDNEIIEIEIFPHTTFKCLLTTNNDSAFQKFITGIKDDVVTTIHFKKSMNNKKYFCLCTDYHALLIPYKLADQINEVITKIQNSVVFCVTEKDQRALSSFESQQLIKSFASKDELEKIRKTLISRISERFGVFNTAHDNISHYTTYMTFFYLTEEVLSTYYDLKKINKLSRKSKKQDKKEGVQSLKKLYESLERKVKVIHKSICDSNKFEGIDSSINVNL